MTSPAPSESTPATSQPVVGGLPAADATPVTALPVAMPAGASMAGPPDATAVPPAGAIVRIATVDGGDPLVRTYLNGHRATCAASTISYIWLFLGALAVIAGAAWAQSRYGTVVPLPPDRGALAHWFNRHFGDWQAVVGGMIAGGLMASLLGTFLARRVPAGQEPLLVMLILIALYLPLYDPLIGVGVLMGAVTLVYLITIAFRILALLVGGGRGLRTESLAMPADGWPMYTVLVPLYRERAVAQNILKALERLDYPREQLDVKFLLEADDDETLPALEAAGIPTWAEVVVVPQGQPKTKPRACNHGLERARGLFTVIFDAEDRPDPDQLKQAVLAFNHLDRRVVCLQAQLAYHNHAQNLLTRWFALEYNVWFRRYLPGLVRLGAPIPLGGTSNHFRTAPLKAIGGWDPFNVTEDCDLGVRLYMAGLRTRTLDSTTFEEANCRVGNWLRQRSRWIKGYFVTHLVWCRRPLALVWKLGPWGAFCFLCSVGAFAALAVLNLALWVMSTTQIICLGIDMAHGHRLVDLLTTRDLAHERWSWPIWFAGPTEHAAASMLSQVFCSAAAVMLAGNLFFILVNLVAGRRPGQRGLWWAAFISPIYWLLISLAAVKALGQLITRPHYWEKTVHGLDTTKS